MIDAVTPEFVQACSLDVSPLSDLVYGTLRVNSFGRLFARPWGFIVIGFKVEGVWDYDKNQVALVIPDPTDFGSWVPVTFGTLIINQIINVIKESEIEELSVSLSGSKISHLLACHQAKLSTGSEMAANQTMGPNDLNEAVKTMKKEDINAFSSKIIQT